MAGTIKPVPEQGEQAFGLLRLLFDEPSWPGSRHSAIFAKSAGVCRPWQLKLGAASRASDCLHANGSRQLQ